MTEKTKALKQAWETRPQTSYERSEHEVSSSRWRNVDRSSNSAARCRSATATRGGATSSRDPLLSRIGHPRRITTPGSRPTVGSSSPGTSGSLTCSATERTTAGA